MENYALSWGVCRSVGLVVVLLICRTTAAALTLTWDDPNNDPAIIRGYRIQRSTDNQATWQYRATAYAPAHSWVDNAVPTVPVCYRVRAWNGFMAGPPSEAVCLIPPAAPTHLRWLVP